MADVIHISEEEAVRDLRALLRRVRSGEEVVVDSENGAEPVVRMTTAYEPPKGRSAKDILEGLRLREEAQGLATPDDGFAADVAEAREMYNAPLDSPAWD